MVNFALTRKRRSERNLQVLEQERSLMRSRRRFIPSCVFLSSLSCSGTARPRSERVERGTHLYAPKHSPSPMRRSARLRAPAIAK